MANRRKKVEAVTDFILGAPQLLGMVTAAMRLKDTFSWKKNYDKPRQHIKEQKHHFANQRPYSQSYGFSSSYVQRWKLGPKESWILKSWCFWIVVLKKAFESPLDCKEIKPANPKGNQSWIFIGRTDAEAPILWPPDAKSWLIGKKPWCWERSKSKGEGGDRGWDGCIASLTQWTWIWANSGR